MKRNNCYCFEDIGIDPEEWDEYTGHNQWNAVYTVQLGELLEMGVFNWNMPELDWKESAYNEDQYSRICDYFIERFYYREISIEPFAEWARTLKRKLVFELMPKYTPLYSRVAEGINPLSSENEYYKNRTIESAYPETLLSENADYITDGKDEEYQRIKEGKLTDVLESFAEKYKGVDELVLDELESLFISLYTTNVNATW